MARRNKKHHKIPRTYLQAFVGADGRFWVADERLNVYTQKPENILTENDYYAVRFESGGGTLDIETKFLNGIEGSYAKLYREKLTERKPITEKDKAILAIFVASMMERQPMRRAALKDFFNQVKEHVTHLRGLPDRVKQNMAKMPNLSSGKGIPADDLLKMGEDVGSLHTSLMPQSIPELAPIIFNMKWAFLVRDSNAPLFITSDKPFTMINPVAEAAIGIGKFGSLPGLGQKDVEISLPLSSDVILFGGWQIEHDALYIPVPKNLVEAMNRRTQRGSRTLISTNKQQLEEIITRVKARKESEHAS